MIFPMISSFNFLLGIIVFSVQQSLVSTLGRNSCTDESLSFYQSINCPDGMIGVGKSCMCSSKNMLCPFATAREYLPPAQLYIQHLNETSECNYHFSRQLDDYIRNWKGYKYHQGFPQDRPCQRKYNNCAYYSVGKFVRFSALMEYFRLKYNIYENTTIISNYLVNIMYPIHWTGSQWRWSDGVRVCRPPYHGWNCAFESLSHTKYFPHSENDPPYESLFSQQFLMKTLQYRNVKINNIIQIMLFGKLLSLLTRPNYLVRQFLSTHLKKVPGTNINHNKKGIIVSMHARFGDACDVIFTSEDNIVIRYALSYAAKKRPCMSMDIYFKKLLLIDKLYSVSSVYLATDSQDMILQTKNYPKYEWNYLNVNRSFLDYKNGFVEFRKRESNKDILFTAVSDLALMRKGDVFIGAFSGHFSKIAYYLMAGVKMTVPPFISVDFPIGCDTVQNCTEIDIINRKLTIEDVISNAPECIRRNFSTTGWGWLADNEDSCGVYFAPH